MRLDKQKHLDAERRVRDSILGGYGYAGKAEDLALIRRKRRERKEVRVGEGEGHSY